MSRFTALSCLSTGLSAAELITLKGALACVCTLSCITRTHTVVLMPTALRRRAARRPKFDHLRDWFIFLHNGATIIEKHQQQHFTNSWLLGSLCLTPLHDLFLWYLSKVGMTWFQHEHCTAIIPANISVRFLLISRFRNNMRENSRGSLYKWKPFYITSCPFNYSTMCLRSGFSFM